MLGTKRVPDPSLPRRQLETNLRLEGLLLFRNAVKPESTPLLRRLKELDLRSVLVTGDNLRNAYHCANQVGTGELGNHEEEARSSQL